ncbi:MAG: amidohydrolase [Bryobacteraceae bacterium]|nr:amidohydrolase [Bryobacterales bacterium]MEB2361440.1 amidohydrolase family protein [Bryobacterales bacterium]NUN02439.1 amidohydrolase [Bryobacteraceae bacterium]
MKTPWGDLPVADAHVHFFSYRFFQLLTASSPDPLPVESLKGRLGWEMPPENPEQLAEQWVAELDKHGVERASLIASAPGDEDSVIAAVRAFPGRFRGCFMVNPCAPDAPERTSRALEAGLRVICLFPAMHRYSIQSDMVERLLESVSSHPGVCVFVHCGVLTVGVRKKLGLPSLFDMKYSNPIDLHAVALRFPTLPFIVPHFGAGYFREALMLADLCPNVYLDTSSGNSWIRYTGPGMDLAAVFRMALDVTGPQRLLFGTDSSFFPRGWNAEVFRAQVQALESLAITAADAASILGGNFHRLLS